MATPGSPRDSVGEIKGAVLPLSYGPRAKLSPAMREEIKRSAWEIAGPAAYPLLMAINTPGGVVTARDAAGLIILPETIPLFARTHEAALGGRGPLRSTIRWRDRERGVTIEFDATKGRLG